MVHRCSQALAADLNTGIRLEGVGGSGRDRAFDVYLPPGEHFDGRVAGLSMSHLLWFISLEAKWHAYSFPYRDFYLTVCCQCVCPMCRSSAS